MIRIDYKDRRPIYQQIIESVEDLALRGILAPNEKLPAVRTLAIDLAINPNTIQRAYQELEKKGVIYSIQGKGSFIGQSPQELRELRSECFWQDTEELITKAKVLGIKEEDFIAKCTEMFKKSAVSEKKSSQKEVENK